MRWCWPLGDFTRFQLGIGFLELCFVYEVLLDLLDCSESASPGTPPTWSAYLCVCERRPEDSQVLRRNRVWASTGFYLCPPLFC